MSVFGFRVTAAVLKCVGVFFVNVVLNGLKHLSRTFLHLIYCDCNWTYDLNSAACFLPWDYCEFSYLYVLNPKPFVCFCRYVQILVTLTLLPSNYMKNIADGRCRNRQVYGDQFCIKHPCICIVYILWNNLLRYHVQILFITVVPFDKTNQKKKAYFKQNRF